MLNKKAEWLDRLVNRHPIVANIMFGISAMALTVMASFSGRFRAFVVIAVILTIKKRWQCSFASNTNYAALFVCGIISTLSCLVATRRFYGRWFYGVVHGGSAPNSIKAIYDSIPAPEAMLNLTIKIACVACGVLAIYALAIILAMLFDFILAMEKKSAAAMRNKPAGGLGILFSPVLIYIVIVSVLILSAASRFYRQFPNSYSWCEVFINYEGGFVRRGLLGQILFIIDGVVPVQNFYVALYVVLFFIFIYFSYKKFIRVFDPLVVGFLFISPVIFWLPVTDQAIFGRKDVWVEIILLCIAQLCANCLADKKVSLYKNTLVIALLFFIGTLIHELTIFFFPLLAVLLGAAYARKQKLFQWLLISITLLALSLSLTVIFSGDAGIRNSIFTSWAERYPQFTTEGAISYIGSSLHHVIMWTYNSRMNWISMGSSLCGLLLSALPLLFLWKAYRPYAAIRGLLSESIVLRLVLIPAVSAPGLLFVIVNDYGRWVSLTFYTYALFLFAVFVARPQSSQPWLNILKEKIFISPRLRYIVYLLAIVYGGSWRMPHWVPTAGSFVQPGILLAPIMKWAKLLWY
jgi:hypothetical protein